MLPGQGEVSAIQMQNCFDLETGGIHGDKGIRMGVRRSEGLGDRVQGLPISRSDDMLHAGRTVRQVAPSAQCQIGGQFQEGTTLRQQHRVGVPEGHAVQAKSAPVRGNWTVRITSARSKSISRASLVRHSNT